MYVVLIIYPDDMMIFTKKKTNEEHKAIVKEVLLHLRKNNLYLKPEKCVFSADKVDFLGMTINKNGIRMQSKKVNTILNWPAPIKLK